jgi:hypothetical protein
VFSPWEKSMPHGVPFHSGDRSENATAYSRHVEELFFTESAHVKTHATNANTQFAHFTA